MHVCRLAGVPWALHAPSQGSLFRLASVQRLIGIRGTRHFVNDACMWQAEARRRWSSLVWGIDPCLLSRPSCPGSKRWRADGLCHTGECVRSPPRVFLQALAVSFAGAALEARANRFETLTVSQLTRQYRRSQEASWLSGLTANLTSIFVQSYRISEAPNAKNIAYNYDVSGEDIPCCGECCASGTHEHDTAAALRYVQVCGRRPTLPVVCV